VPSRHGRQVARVPLPACPACATFPWRGVARPLTRLLVLCANLTADRLALGPAARLARGAPGQWLKDGVGRPHARTLVAGIPD